MPGAKPKVVYDCVTCGACCYNPNDNREIDYPWYVDIDEDDAILGKKKHRHLVMFDDNEEPHMRLNHLQRCVALKGRLGVKVGCSIYADRPSGCRRFEAGSRRCKKYRIERGIDQPPAPRAKRPSPSERVGAAARKRPAASNAKAGVATR